MSKKVNQKKNVIVEIFRSQFRVKSLYPSGWDCDAPKNDTIYFVSSFSYMILAILVFHSTNVSSYVIYDEDVTNLGFSIALVLQSYFTYNADVEYIGKKSTFHSLDRFFATLMCVLFGLNIWFISTDERMIFIMGVPVSLSLLCRSRIARIRGVDPREYIFWHTGWHFHLPLNTALWVLMRQPGSIRPLYMLISMILNIFTCLLHVAYPPK